MSAVLAGSLRGRVVSTDAWGDTTKSGQKIVKHSWAPAEPAVIAAAGSIADAAFGEDSEDETPETPAAPTSPAAAPTAPSTTLEQRAAAAGWWPNPNAAGWFYNAVGEQKPSVEIVGMFPG